MYLDRTVRSMLSIAQMNECRLFWHSPQYISGGLDGRTARPSRRIHRSEPDAADSAAVRTIAPASDASDPAVADTVARGPAETPAPAKPAPASAAPAAAPKSGKKKVVLLGVGAVLA